MLIVNLTLHPQKIKRKNEINWLGDYLVLNVIKLNNNLLNN
jgi:hypothetical protein